MAEAYRWWSMPKSGGKASLGGGNCERIKEMSGIPFRCLGAWPTGKFRSLEVLISLF